MFYVFNITGGGHIIISADDKIEPIRAYVPDEDYNVNSDIELWDGKSSERITSILEDIEFNFDNLFD